MKKIFISQEVLDTLFAESKADLEGERLTIHSKGNQVFKLTPAYKILHLAEGGADPSDMVGKIYTKNELERVSADIYMDSVIINEVAYQAESGFIGVPEGTPEAEKEPEGEISDSELLSDYLLKIL